VAGGKISQDAYQGSAQVNSSKAYLVFFDWDRA
jgi:hypothetical protein